VAVTWWDSNLGLLEKIESSAIDPSHCGHNLMKQDCFEEINGVRYG